MKDSLEKIIEKAPNGMKIATVFIAIIISIPVNIYLLLRGKK